MATQPRVQRRLGGNRAALFVYGKNLENPMYVLLYVKNVLFVFIKLYFQFLDAAMEGLENMAFVANAVSLITYFTGSMNFSLTKSATTLTNLMGTAFLLPLLGGLISDTYLSRFKTCVLFACMELLVSLVNFSCSQFFR